MGQTVNLLAMPSVVRIHHYPLSLISGNSSVDRALAFQAGGRGFEPRFPLNLLTCCNSSVVEHFLGKEEVSSSILDRGSQPAAGPAGRGGVAQLVEQAAHNRCVAGSSPALATAHDTYRAVASRAAARRAFGRSRLVAYPGGDRGARARSHVPQYDETEEEAPAVAKTTDVRPKITMACTECKERNYITKKNRRNDPDRLDLMKFCSRCKKHTTHRETR